MNKIKAILVFTILIFFLLFGCNQIRDVVVDDFSDDVVVDDETVLDIASVGNNVSVHYLGTLENGEKFDSSYDRNETLDFVIGEGNLIADFENAVVGMSVGEKKEIIVQPENAYGIVDPEKIITIDANKFEDFDSIVEGMQVQGAVVGVVLEKTDYNATIDFNHKLAGQVLNFVIELVSIN
jgi:FKBP-type peptidyl-prolyl cis-trans isomerase 2